MTERLLIATGNAGKRREFETLLDDVVGGAEVFDTKSWPSPLPEVVEDGDTFAHNAIKKACEISRVTGVTTLSDDSGLEVDALDGRPGVYSARFAGENASDAENNAFLVNALKGVPQQERAARYVAVICLCLADDDLGQILSARIGSPTRTAAGFGDVEEGELTRLGDRSVIWVRDTCEGLIVDEPRGEGGFGYDPYFFIPEWELRMAEVPLERKNQISHRAKATRKLLHVFRD